MIRLRETVKQCRFRELQDIDADVFTKWLAAKEKADELSQQTVIYYRSHLRSFVRWLIKSRKLGHDPLITVQVQTRVTERKMARRALSDEEVAKLLDTANESEIKFRYMDGKSRHAVYAAALATGLRAGALASLRVKDFDLDAETPTVSLSIKRDKSRRGKFQPIPTDYVPILKAYLEARGGTNSLGLGSGSSAPPTWFVRTRRLPEFRSKRTARMAPSDSTSTRCGTPTSPIWG